MTNQGRDWVVGKQEFPLASTPTSRSEEVIGRIGQELAADPEMGPLVLSHSNLRASRRWRTARCSSGRSSSSKPGEQFVIRREAYQRIKEAFDEAGIHFAHRQVTVYVPPGRAPPRPLRPRRVPPPWRRRPERSVPMTLSGGSKTWASTLRSRRQRAVHAMAREVRPVRRDH